MSLLSTLNPGPVCLLNFACALWFCSVLHTTKYSLSEIEHHAFVNLELFSLLFVAAYGHWHESETSDCGLVKIALILIIMQTKSRKSSKSQVLSGLNCSVVQFEVAVVVKYPLTCSCWSDFWSGATGCNVDVVKWNTFCNGGFYFENCLDFPLGLGLT